MTKRESKLSIKTYKKSTRPSLFFRPQQTIYAVNCCIIIAQSTDVRVNKIKRPYYLKKADNPYEWLKWRGGD